MERYVDLHTHTSVSDGSMTPSRLVAHAKACGLAAIAVTDHDTVEGIEEAERAAEQVGIQFLPGVEISVRYEREMHILGYFTKHCYKGLKNILIELISNRNNRNPRIISKLNEMGMNISMKEVAGAAAGSIIGRPHIAAILVQKGYVKDTAEAFDRYLAFGKPAYVEKDKLTPKEGIEAIYKAGGAAVLAHPVLSFGAENCEKLLEELVPYGLQGIEAYYSENSASDTKMLTSLAERYGLIATGGSDFHGAFKPEILIGKGHGNLKVPYEAYEALCAAIER